MEKKDRIFLNSVFFVVGFVVVFSIVGILLQTLISSVAVPLMGALRIIGGLVIIAFGAILMVSTRRMIPFLSGEHRMRFRRLGNSFVSSFVFGVAFAIGWTPCVGPYFGAIYTLALTTPGTGFFLLLSYSLGLGIPFLIAGASISRFSKSISRLGPFLKYFNAVSGVFLIAIGLLVVTDYIGVISVFLVGLGGYLSLTGSLDFLIAIAAGILTFLSPCILPLVPRILLYRRHCFLGLSQ